MKQWKHKKLSSIMVEVMVFFITELGTVIGDFFLQYFMVPRIYGAEDPTLIMTMTQAILDSLVYR